MIMGMCPQSYWHLRIDNVNPSVTTPSTNQRIMCKLTSYPATSLFHLAFKNVLPKPFREFELFSALAVLDSPSSAYNKLPSPQSSVSRLPLLCMRRVDPSLVGNPTMVLLLTSVCKNRRVWVTQWDSQDMPLEWQGQKGNHPRDS